MNGPLSHTFRRLADGRGVFYGWFEAMHSRFDVLLCGADEAASSALCRRIADETDRIEGRLNRFDEASEAWRFNRSGGGRLHADPETLAVFADAARYRERTDGAFDICVRTPDYTGEGDCYRVDPSCDAIEKTWPEAIVDFGGYAKGFALERARQCVVAAGVPSALLSFGNSSVCAVGSHPSGQPWQVGVENPLRRGECMTTVPLCDASLSSSGNTPRNRGHIRSVATGRDRTDDRVVSVWGPSPLDCEVLSTALFAATGEQRLRIFDNFPSVRARAMDFSASGCSVTEFR